MHQYFVLNATGCIGGKLDILVTAVGADGLDKTDRADGYEVLQIHARIFKPAGDKYHKPQIMLNQLLLCPFVPHFKPHERLLLLLSFQRRRQHIRTADVMNAILRNQPQLC